MSEETTQQQRDQSARPASSFVGPIAELVGQRMLSPPSRPGVLATVDRFEVLRVVGGGGMGVVLQARDPNSGLDVAVKMVRAELAGNSRALHLFVKEAGHMRRLRHTNVMPVLEVSDRAEGPYMVMPYFERGSLARRIQVGRGLEPSLVLDIASQIAEGLRFAHQRGIIHRDLKPANILLAANDKACLADFGLARTLFNDSIMDVESQQCEGTAPYMSPAVAAGHAEDTRCDIYAFGALLYEMLTGQPPYSGQTTKQIREQILSGPPKSIVVLNPNADRRLVTVAEGAMARELRNRYADMVDVLADLERIKEGKAPVGPRDMGRKVRHTMEGVRRIPKAVWITVCLAGLVALVLLLRRPTVSTAPTVPPTPTEPVQLAQRWTFTPPPSVPATPTEPMQPSILQNLRAVAVDSSGDLYVADEDNNTVSKITPAGVVTELAGKRGTPGTLDGSRGDARFSILRGITIDRAGNLYVADSYTVRKITPAGDVNTLAGKAGTPGTVDGAGSEARFSIPSGVAVDDSGNVYVADTYTIRKITPAGVVSTLAGGLRHAGSADGTGASARFSDQAKGVAVDKEGNVYVADTYNNTIRKITPSGVVSTVAGAVGQRGHVDGTGGTARFNDPQGIAVDGRGNIYVADRENQVIRRVTPNSVVSTLTLRSIGVNGSR
jgi:serine/threonine protein kinase